MPPAIRTPKVRSTIKMALPFSTFFLLPFIRRLRNGRLLIMRAIPMIRSSIDAVSIQSNPCAEASCSRQDLFLFAFALNSGLVPLPVVFADRDA